MFTADFKPPPRIARYDDNLGVPIANFQNSPHRCVKFFPETSRNSSRTLPCSGFYLTGSFQRIWHQVLLGFQQCDSEHLWRPFTAILVLFFCCPHSGYCSLSLLLSSCQPECYRYHPGDIPPVLVLTIILTRCCLCSSPRLSPLTLSFSWCRIALIVSTTPDVISHRSKARVKGQPDSCTMH